MDLVEDGRYVLRFLLVGDRGDPGHPRWMPVVSEGMYLLHVWHTICNLRHVQDHIHSCKASEGNCDGDATLVFQIPQWRWFQHPSSYHWNGSALPSSFTLDRWMRWRVTDGREGKLVVETSVKCCLAALPLRLSLMVLQKRGLRLVTTD